MSIYPYWVVTQSIYPDWLGGYTSALLDYIVTCFDPLALSISARDCLLLLCFVSDPLALNMSEADLLELDISMSDPLALTVTARDPLALTITRTL